MQPTDLETRITARLVDMLGESMQRGVPPDLIVRCLLGGALALALRHDNGSSIAAQLEPVLDALRDVDEQPRPSVQ